MKSCMDCSVDVTGIRKRCDKCASIRNKINQSKWRLLNRDATRLHRKTWVEQNSDYLKEKRIVGRDLKKGYDKKRLEIERGGPARVAMTVEEKAGKRKVLDSLRDKSIESMRCRSWKLKNPLANCIVASRLELKIADCPPGILDMKRTQMILKRLSRHVKQTLKEAS